MTLTKKQKAHQLAISPKGGRATVAKYGVEHMREIARKGVEAKRRKAAEKAAGSATYRKPSEENMVGLEPLPEDGVNLDVEGETSGQRPPEKKKNWLKRLLF